MGIQVTTTPQPDAPFPKLMTRNNGNVYLVKSETSTDAVLLHSPSSPGAIGDVVPVDIAADLYDYSGPLTLENIT